MRVVVALGGNALLRRGEPMTADVQRRNVRVAAEAMAPIAKNHQLVVSHGNGPQVGLLALQNEAYRDVHPYPLDVLGAQTEGMIGYLLEQEIANRLPPGREVATLLTRVEVARDDAAFAAPSKPIGPVYDAQRGAALARERGWQMMADKWFYFGSDAPIEPASIARTFQALRESSEAGVPRLLGQPSTYMGHRDLSWAPNSYTILDEEVPAQVVFRGQHLL